MAGDMIGAAANAAEEIAVMMTSAREGCWNQQVRAAPFRLTV